MLIIGHRGAAGLAPENTLAAMQAGFDADADVLEFDVRLTKDNIPVILHDSRLLRTHGTFKKVASLTYSQLADLTKDQPVTKLSDILDEYFGKIMLNIELKSKGSGDVVFALIKKNYITSRRDWDKFFISSFNPRELMALRKKNKLINLALLHSENSFIFIAYHRSIKLCAVGFHRLYLNRLAVAIAKKAGLFIYAYTVDRPGAIPILEEQSIDGIVTNHPDRMRAALLRREQTDR